jgi:hypothetical protein
MRKLLEHIRETQGPGRVIKSVPATSEEKSKAIPNEQDIIQTITHVSSTFHITPNMLCMDDIVGQKPLKYLAQIQLVMGPIPTKELYKLQFSFAQSCTHIDAIDLQHTKDNREELELVLEKVNLETEYDRLEHGLVVAYDKIPKSAQITESTSTQKIDQIMKTIDQ